MKPTVRFSSSSVSTASSWKKTPEQQDQAELKPRRKFTLERFAARELQDASAAEDLQEWIESEIDNLEPSDASLGERLESGSILCRLALSFGQVTRFHLSPANEFQRLENFELFKKACSAIGIVAAPPSAKRGQALLREALPCLTELAQIAAKRRGGSIGSPKAHAQASHSEPIVSQQSKPTNSVQVEDPELDFVVVSPRAMKARLSSASPLGTGADISKLEEHRHPHPGGRRFSLLGEDDESSHLDTSTTDSSSRQALRNHPVAVATTSSKPDESMNELLGSLHALRLARLKAKPPKLKLVQTGGVLLTVIERPGESLGSIVWGGAFTLIEHLAKHESKRFSCKETRVLELGAGVGVCGIWAACMGADVLVTDVDDSVMETLWSNVSANANVIVKAGGSCSARGLDAGNLESVRRLVAKLVAPDEEGEEVLPLVVLASDVLYNDVVEPMTAAVKEIFTLAPSSVLFLAYKPRDEAAEAVFFEALTRDLGVCFERFAAGDHFVFRATIEAPSA